jgi:hypothetical protein
MEVARFVTVFLQNFAVVSAQVCSEHRTVFAEGPPFSPAEDRRRENIHTGERGDTCISMRLQQTILM